MFGLTAEQEQLRREVRAFAEREMAPHVSRWDEASEFPHEVVKKLGPMGLLGVIFPEALGGAGMGYVEYVLAIEELSRVDGSVGITMAAHNSLCTNHIMLAGNDAQRQRWVPKLATGEWLGAWALTEPGSGSDAAGCEDYGGAAWRWLGAEWVEDFHHEWDLCGLRGGAGGNGSGERDAGDFGVCGGEGYEGISSGRRRTSWG